MREPWFERLLSRVHLTIDGDGDPAASGGGGAADSPAADPAADPPSADQADGGGLAGLADGGDPVEPTDPKDWRVEASGGDEKLLRELKRYASPQTVAKALLEAKARIRAGFQPPALPDGATPEQVAEYRKAVGVPETPDGYGVAFAPEVKADDRLNEMLKGYLAFAHERNIPPAAVKAAVEWQQSEILRQREEASAAASRERARIQQELRREYGADMKRNLGLADEFLQAHPGIAKLVNADNPDIEVVRDIVALALDTAPPDRVYEGDSAAGGKSLDEQIAELRVKSVNGKLTKAEDARYNQLLAARMRRDERGSRAA